MMSRNPIIREVNRFNKEVIIVSLVTVEGVTCVGIRMGSMMKVDCKLEINARLDKDYDKS